MSESYHQNHRRSSAVSLSDKIVIACCGKVWTFQRRDTEFRAFVKRFLMSRLFRITMISTISMNAIFVVLWANFTIRLKFYKVFEVGEVIFVSIYSAEFYAKLYVDPIGYWKDGYNVLDMLEIIILSIPFTLKKIKGKHYPYLNVAHGLQSLRILKLINYSRGMRTLINAVGQTVFSVASVLCMFFILMYIFAILGFCLFGSSDMGDQKNWGSLALSFFTLFSLATVDGWTDLQEQLDARGLYFSRFFTIIFISLASFIFLNMFVAVMIFHTEDSINKFERQLKIERQVTVMEEKQVIVKQQQETINILMQAQNIDCRCFSNLVKDFKSTLKHDDPMVLDDFGTSLPFIGVYLATLDNQDKTIYKLQKLYYEIVHVLKLMLEEMHRKDSQS
ncbi:cation channel sperm-associated protein 3 [Suncus etruscus]|uniref:cation channel sperm-associated protein 3 n=1 Tax=Suncus etruscus TaxID=109475 RepID=UPI0021106B77|nr:cation channel sperm-associated protein 3 [Suncus etruscus]